MSKVIVVFALIGAAGKVIWISEELLKEHINELFEDGALNEQTLVIVKII